MNLASLLSVALGAILADNFIFSRFLGGSSFMDNSKTLDTAAGMGLAVMCAMSAASVLAWLIHKFVLIPLRLEFLQTFAYILIIVCLVQLAELLLRKLLPALCPKLGICLPAFCPKLDACLPSVRTSCAVLGVALLSTRSGLTFVESVVFGVAAGAGFLLAIVLFACVRERLEYSDCPKSFEGLPIALVSAGLIALAFSGFAGLQIR